MLSSAWQIKPSGPKSWRSTDAISNLHLNDFIPVPSVGDLAPQTALVRIRAAAINARDMMVIARDPIYPIVNLPNLTPCIDGAGEVFSVGPESNWKIGDRVMINPTSWIDAEEVPTLGNARGKGAGDVQGTLRQFGIYEDKELILAPPHLTFEEIASLPAAAGTAMNALAFGPLTPKAGMTVLTQGTGGVSCFVIQLASALGATVICTSSSDAKLSIAKKLGATHCINYKTFPAWEEEILRITNRKGVDHVCEMGGSGTIEQSLKCVKQGGLVSAIGILTESKMSDILPEIVFGGKTLRGVFNIKKEHAEAVVNLMNKHQIRPQVGEVFEWEDAKEAFRKSMDWNVVGKIVIKV